MPSSSHELPHLVINGSPVDFVDLQLFLRLGRTGDLPHAEMGDALDGSRDCSADSIVNPAFGIVLLHHDHISTHLFDILPQALDVQWFQGEDVQYTNRNGIG